MSFEHGDDDLIEALIKSGESLASIAQKWDLIDEETGEPDVDTLRTFCKRKGISIPRKNPRPDKNGCRKYRLLAEKGSYISPTVQQIITLSKTTAADVIAKKVNRSKAYVIRMLELHVKKDAKARHKLRVNEVRGLIDSLGISASEACVMAGVTIGKYQYSCRQLGLHK